MPNKTDRDREINQAVGERDQEIKRVDTIQRGDSRPGERTREPAVAAKKESGTGIAYNEEATVSHSAKAKARDDRADWEPAAEEPAENPWILPNADKGPPEHAVVEIETGGQIMKGRHIGGVWRIVGADHTGRPLDHTGTPVAMDKDGKPIVTDQNKPAPAGSTPKRPTDSEQSVQITRWRWIGKKVV